MVLYKKLSGIYSVIFTILLFINLSIYYYYYYYYHYYYYYFNIIIIFWRTLLKQIFFSGTSAFT